MLVSSPHQFSGRESLGKSNELKWYNTHSYADGILEIMEFLPGELEDL